jgi:hypothetical protein
MRDSDGTQNPDNSVYMNFTTLSVGQNDHTFDFGFSSDIYDLALRKTTTSTGVNI